MKKTREEYKPMTEENLAILATLREDLAAGRFCTIQEFNREMDELDALQ
jgi:hypothetical protein